MIPGRVAFFQLMRRFPGHLVMRAGDPVILCRANRSGLGDAANIHEVITVERSFDAVRECDEPVNHCVAFGDDFTDPPLEGHLREVIGVSERGALDLPGSALRANEIVEVSDGDLVEVRHAMIFR